MTQPDTPKLTQVIAVQRKGRIKGGLIGGLLLGPIGLIGGTMLGTRTQIRIAEEASAPKTELRPVDQQIFGLIALVVVGCLLYSMFF
ncbi:MAG TPA: hypothetical protein VIJ62_00410 [Rhizomicrobium sp.]